MAKNTSTLGFGIDIGGSGMKAGIVDLTSGRLVSKRHRISTPQPATPTAMAAVVRKLIDHHDWDGPVGIAFPSIVREGVIRLAANIDATWVGVDAAALFSEACRHRASVVNDADAAGLAEMRFGAGRGRRGVVIMFTFGTGIGSGLFVDGTLVPNTELGHLELDGHDAETQASAAVRERDGIGWKKWASRVERYLRHVEMLFSPDLIIVGGGASKVAEKWLPLIRLDTDVLPAVMANNAGIVGAALVAPGTVPFDSDVDGG